MDEAKIVAQVAQNIPKPDPAPAAVEKKVEEKPEPTLSAFETNVELNDPAISLQIADHFGLSKIDRLSEERQAQLRTIYRWAAEQAGSVDKGAVLQQLMLLEMELGSTFKDNRIDRVAKWVKLKNQSESIRKEMETLSNG